MSSSNNNLTHLERAKNKIKHGKTVSSIKQEIRTEFLNRIRRERASSFDKYRKILDDESTCDLRELRTILLNDSNITALLNFEEISDMFRETENEIRELELECEHERYLEELQKETDSLIPLNECQLCNKPTLNLLCTECVYSLNN